MQTPDGPFPARATAAWPGSPERIPPDEIRQLADDGSWKIWSYRGATVRSWGKTNRLVMPGHPLDGTYLGRHEAWFPIIDRWLDYGDLPAPYV